MRQKSIGLFINSIAGGGKAITLARKVSARLTALEINHVWILDNWPEESDEFSEIWIFGGDGTLNYFINKYPEIKLPLVMFSGGTGNDLSWKINRNIATEDFLVELLESKSFSVDAGRCNGRLFLNGVGIGFDGEVLKSINSIRYFGGHLGYLIAVIQNIFTFRERKFSLSFNHIKIDQKYLLLFIGNSSRTGGGFHISPLAEIDDGLLDLILVDPLSPMKRLFYLPKIEKGRHLTLDITAHHTLQSIKIQCDGICPAQIDGELIHSDLFDIEILPKHFNFKTVML
ncbi:MAG TPA: diacylglycerol kinase family protein [Saprospiraceae bacterium]|nr:diacylglycerol kinase family protein [Saprospiraceae bacterium]HQW56461.1 diacylglycerol kinase family protein [Saprospiraceae bacterium]